MDIETLERNARFSAEELYKTTGKSVGGPTGYCLQFVDTALCGVVPQDAPIGWLQKLFESQLGIHRLETIYAEIHTLDEILHCYDESPGIPIIIEGHPADCSPELHSALFMRGTGGRWIVVDSLLSEGFSIFSSFEEVESWAHRTFYLDTALFYPVEVDE
ncbi:MAG: hypothetical protein Q8L37_05185 [Candidatus Gottesmanbacteria bacterium]|nr:hypothetical protein [Candidatus Gottesmanbacteria bacterium]